MPQSTPQPAPWEQPEHEQAAAAAPTHETAWYEQATVPHVETPFVALPPPAAPFHDDWADPSPAPVLYEQPIRQPRPEPRVAPEPAPTWHYEQAPPFEQILSGEAAVTPASEPALPSLFEQFVQGGALPTEPAVPHESVPPVALTPAPAPAPATMPAVTPEEPAQIFAAEAPAPVETPVPAEAPALADAPVPTEAPMPAEAPVPAEAPAPSAALPPAEAPVAAEPPLPSRRELRRLAGSPPPPPAARPQVAAPAAAVAPAAAGITDIASYEDFDDEEFEATIVVPRSKKPTSWKLVDLDGTAYALHPSNVLGRKPAPASAPEDAQLVSLSDAERVLSRTHALLEVENDELWVTDLGSTNGTDVLDAEGHIAITCEPGARQLIASGQSLSFGGRIVAFAGPEA